MLIKARARALCYRVGSPLTLAVSLMTLSLFNSRKLLDGLGDNAQTLTEFSLGNNQGRGETDDISVSWLGLRVTTIISIENAV